MSAAATTLTADDAHISFAKRLAHNNKETRCSALRKLKRWLVTKSKQGTLEQTEIIKIWKGLHYSMWYSDKPLIQEALALDISQIVTLMPDVEDSVRFFGGFCQTIAREWVLIDKLRLDKFYMFIRTALKCVLEFCAEKAWDDDIVSKVVEELDTTIINSGGSCPSSVSVYISEHFLELYSTVYTETTPTLFITKLLMSYITTLSQTPKKDLSRVIMNNLFNPITEKTVDFRIDLQMLSSHIQQLAIQTGILTRNRKLLYRLRNDLTVAVQGDLVTLSPLGKHKLVDTPLENGIGSGTEESVEGSPEPEKRKKKRKSVSGEGEPMSVDTVKSETTVNGHVDVSTDLVVKEEGNDDEKTVVGEVMGETKTKSKRKKKSKAICKEEPVANSDVINVNSDVIVAESDVIVASVADNTESVICEQPADECMESIEEREVIENQQTGASPIAPNDDNIISESPDETTTSPEDTEHDNTPTDTTPTETPDVASTATPELVNGDSDRQPVAEQITPAAKSPVRRRSERKKRRKSVEKTPTIVASTPIPATPVVTTPTTQTSGTKKKVRLSMENNQTYFFKKNASLESPAPFDGTRTPVKGVLKTSPAVTRSRSRQGRGKSRLRR